VARFAFRRNAGVNNVLFDCILYDMGFIESEKRRIID